MLKIFFKIVKIVNISKFIDTKERIYLLFFLRIISSAKHHFYSPLLRSLVPKVVHKVGLHLKYSMGTISLINNHSVFLY